MDSFREKLNLAKTSLKRTCNQIINSVSYKNDNFEDRDLKLLIKDFVGAWNDLIYNSGYFSEEDFSNKKSYGYQIRAWFEVWRKEFEEEIYFSLKHNYYFLYSDALAFLLEITNHYLVQSNKAEEQVSLARTIFIKRGIISVGIWITEKEVENPTPNLFPLYLPISSTVSKILHGYRWVDEERRNYPVDSFDTWRRPLYRKIAGENLKVNLKQAINLSSFKKGKEFLEYKNRLALSVKEIITHPAWLNGDYSGMDFFQKLEDFVKGWTSLIYNNFKKFLPFGRKWISWVHSFNFECSQTFFRNLPFRYPEFLKGIIGQTEKFLSEEDFEKGKSIFETRYFLERSPGLIINSEVVFQKYINGSNLKNPRDLDLLNDYFPADLTAYLQGPEYFEAIEAFFRFQINNSNYKEGIVERKEKHKKYLQKFWDTALAACEEGILVNNYEKKLLANKGHFKVIADFIEQTDAYIPVEEVNRWRRGEKIDWVHYFTNPIRKEDTEF